MPLLSHGEESEGRQEGVGGGGGGGCGAHVECSVLSLLCVLVEEVLQERSLDQLLLSMLVSHSFYSSYDIRLYLAKSGYMHASNDHMNPD